MERPGTPGELAMQTMGSQHRPRERHSAMMPVGRQRRLVNVKAFSLDSAACVRLVLVPAEMLNAWNKKVKPIEVHIRDSGLVLPTIRAKNLILNR